MDLSNLKSIKIARRRMWEDFFRDVEIKSCGSSYEADESLHHNEYELKNLEQELSNEMKRSWTLKASATSSTFKAKIARRKGNTKKNVLIPDSNTKFLLESQIVMFKDFNCIVNLDKMDILLEKKDKENIRGYIKFCNDTGQLQQMFKIINFIEQKYPFLSKCITGLLILERKGETNSERYNTTWQGVKEEFVELSNHLPKKFIEKYKDYILWFYEQFRHK